MDFRSKLAKRWKEQNSFLCVGLDPDLSKLPKSCLSDELGLLRFCEQIVDASQSEVCAFKFNSAFFESAGSKGVEQLKIAADYIKEKYPEIPIILDYKRGDIGNSNEHYAKFGFDYIGADAVTVSPWAGMESLEPFLSRKDKTTIVLVKTSNPGSGEIQDLQVSGTNLYLKLASDIKEKWDYNSNCAVVVGATYPKELESVRNIVGDDMVILIPGLGAQSGDVNTFVKAGVNKDGEGVVINASRSVIFASSGDDFAAAAAEAARSFKEAINKARS